MFVLPWEDKYLTGIELIDKQHKEIITMINMFSVKAEKKPDYNETVEMLNHLTHYAATHFQAEESFMAISNYPDYRDHAAVHKQMNFELKRIRIALDESDLDESKLMDETLKFIQDWPKKHIAILDHKFSKYYRKYLEEL